jgi:hypothetical protein
VICDSACRAIAAARSVDEVKEIANRAEAARAYGKQAKNRQLELDALEIRVRAERRLGEIIFEIRKERKLGSRGRRPRRDSQNETVTLRDLGISGNISAIAQRLALLPENRFSSEMSDWRVRTEAAQRVETPLQRYR